MNSVLLLLLFLLSEFVVVVVMLSYLFRKAEFEQQKMELGLIQEQMSKDREDRL